MIRLGIIGYPLGHSLSPLMHNAALSELGIEGEYIKLETEPSQLRERIEYLKKEGFTGINVTIPHKVNIIDFLDSIDDHAKTAGAVNTLKFTEDGQILGFNTDIYGFTEAFNVKQKEFLSGKTAAVFGAGGAARAVAIGLIELRLDKIVFYARNPENAEQFIAEIKEKSSNTQIELKQLCEDINLSYASVVVNTTPLGMQGKFEGLSPVNQNSLETLTKNAIVYDIVYKPKTTKFIELANNVGLTTIEGIEMLVLQGAKAFEIWTGKKAPVEIMRKTAVNNL